MRSGEGWGVILKYPEREHSKISFLKEEPGDKSKLLTQAAGSAQLGHYTLKKTMLDAPIEVRYNVLNNI